MIKELKLAFEEKRKRGKGKIVKIVKIVKKGKSVTFGYFGNRTLTVKKGIKKKGKKENNY
jgi:hypothetical protein